MRPKKQIVKTKQLLIRLSEQEERLLKEAARRDNLPTGTWLRRLGLIEARRAEKVGDR